MFDDWRKLREIQKAINAGNEEIAQLRDKKDEESREQRMRSYKKVAYQLQLKEIRQSVVITRKARKRGVELPSRREKPLWYADDDEDGSMPPEAVTVWLSEVGRIGAAKLIKLEWRADVEWWWTKILLPALTALIPILALILGLVSVARR
jgi:hypothetical protein